MENDSDISRINNLTFNNSANIGNENWVYLFSGTTVSISIQPLYNLHIAMINVSNHIPLHRLLIFLPNRSPNVSIFLSVFSIFIAKFVSLPAIDQSKRTPSIRTIHHRSKTFILVLLSLFPCIVLNIQSKAKAWPHNFQKKSRPPSVYVTLHSRVTTQQSSRSPRSIRGTFRLPSPDEELSPVVRGPLLSDKSSSPLVSLPRIKKATSTLPLWKSSAG